MGSLLQGAARRPLSLPALGLRTSGTGHVHVAGHDEVNEAGDALLLPAGHTPALRRGPRFVLFSPAEHMAEVNAVIQRNVAAMQSA